MKLALKNRRTRIQTYGFPFGAVFQYSITPSRRVAGFEDEDDDEDEDENEALVSFGPTLSLGFFVSLTNVPSTIDE
jgi:hypothetical protein